MIFFSSPASWQTHEVCMYTPRFRPFPVRPSWWWLQICALGTGLTDDPRAAGTGECRTHVCFAFSQKLFTLRWPRVEGRVPPPPHRPGSFGFLAGRCAELCKPRIPAAKGGLSAGGRLGHLQGLLRRREVGSGGRRGGACAGPRGAGPPGSGFPREGRAGSEPTKPTQPGAFRRPRGGRRPGSGLPHPRVTVPPPRNPLPQFLGRASAHPGYLFFVCV